MKTTYHSLLAIVVILISWLAIPGSTIINPQSVVVGDHNVTMVRTFPLEMFTGSFTASLTEQVIPEDGDLICSNKSSRLYGGEAFEKLVETWTIHSWAKNCLEAGPSIYVATWSPRFLDIVPLRPITLEVPVNVKPIALKDSTTTLSID